MECHKLKNKDSEFSYFLHSNNIDIAIITETWLRPETKLNFTDYEIVRHDSAGGLAIIIKKSLQFYILPSVDINNCEMLMIKLKSNVDLTIGAIYISPSVHFSFNDLKTIFNEYSRVILGGDMNAKHQAWNNFTNNTRGVRLQKFIDHNNISIISSNSYSYKQPRCNPSNLDILLAKNIPYTTSCYTVEELASKNL